MSKYLILTLFILSCCYQIVRPADWNMAVQLCKEHGGLDYIRTNDGEIKAVCNSGMSLRFYYCRNSKHNCIPTKPQLEKE